MNTNALKVILLASFFTCPSMASEEINHEASHQPPNFADIDINEDGFLDKEEMAIFRGKGLGDDDELSDDDASSKTKLSAFASFDKDKDGYITETELLAHSKYSNPGNGTGERKSLDKADKKSRSKGKDKSNKGRNKGSKGSKDKKK